MLECLNKKTIVGNVAHDPQVHVNHHGTKYVHFIVITHEKWKNSRGILATNKDHHRVSCKGNKVEEVIRNIHKGDKVYIEGPVRTKNVESDGKERFYEVLIMKDFLVLEKKQNLKGDVNEMHT